MLVERELKCEVLFNPLCGHGENKYNELKIRKRLLEFSLEILVHAWLACFFCVHNETIYHRGRI